MADSEKFNLYKDLDQEYKRKYFEGGPVFIYSAHRFHYEDDSSDGPIIESWDDDTLLIAETPVSDD